MNGKRLKTKKSFKRGNDWDWKIYSENLSKNEARRNFWNEN